MLVLHLTFICFSSLTRWENNVSCLVSTHTTQTLSTKVGEHESFCHIHGSLTIRLDICGQEYTHYVVQYTLCSLFHSKPLECTGQTPSLVVIFVPSDFIEISWFWQLIYKLTQFCQVLPLVTSHFLVSWWVARLLLRRPFLYILAGNSGTHFRTVNEI